jgi:hypothetical protein
VQDIAAEFVIEPERLEGGSTISLASLADGYAMLNLPAVPLFRAIAAAAVCESRETLEELSPTALPPPPLPGRYRLKGKALRAEEIRCASRRDLTRRDLRLSRSCHSIHVRVIIITLIWHQCTRA